MKNLTFLLLTFLSTFCLCGQTKEIVYNTPEDSTSNYYIAFKPVGQPKGLLVLLTSFGEPPEIALEETDIHKEALLKGIVTVYASLQYGTMTFFIDSLSQTTLDNLISDLQKKYNVKNKPFYLGGFSLGGAGVVKYAERTYSSGVLPKPNAIFALDPPLDFERLYLSMGQEFRSTKNEEAQYFIERMKYEFRSTPDIDKTPFHIISPYSYSDTLQTNIKSLITCPIMLITEPDLIWQMEERQRSIYDLNALDCSAVINTLKLLGNKNAVLTITSGKGYRKYSGKRNPHSWSIMDSNQTIKWMLQHQ